MSQPSEHCFDKVERGSRHFHIYDHISRLDWLCLGNLARNGRHFNTTYAISYVVNSTREEPPPVHETIYSTPRAQALSFVWSLSKSSSSQISFTLVVLCRDLLDGYDASVGAKVASSLNLGISSMCRRDNDVCTS